MVKEARKDCFGYKNSSYCGALTEMICAKKGRCSFYKTKEEFVADRQKYGTGANYAEIHKKKQGEG